MPPKRFGKPPYGPPVPAKPSPSILGGRSNASLVNPLPVPPSPMRRCPVQRCTSLQSRVPVLQPLSQSADSPAKRSCRVSFVDALPRLPSPPPIRGRRPSNNTSSSDPVQILNDRLGTLVRNLSQSLHDAGSWEDFLRSFKDQSYLSPTVGDINHPAAKLLQRWREDGVPVNTSFPPLVIRPEGRVHPSRLLPFSHETRTIPTRRNGQLHRPQAMGGPPIRRRTTPTSDVLPCSCQGRERPEAAATLRPLLELAVELHQRDHHPSLSSRSHAVWWSTAQDPVLRMPRQPEVR